MIPGVLSLASCSITRPPTFPPGPDTFFHTCSMKHFSCLSILSLAGVSPPAPHFASGSHSHSCNGLNIAKATAAAAAPSTWCHLVMLFDAFKGYRSGDDVWSEVTLRLEPFDVLGFHYKSEQVQSVLCTITCNSPLNRKPVFKRISYKLHPLFFNPQQNLGRLLLENGRPRNSNAIRITSSIKVMAITWFNTSSPTRKNGATLRSKYLGQECMNENPLSDRIVVYRGNPELAREIICLSRWNVTLRQRSMCEDHGSWSSLPGIWRTG